MNGSATTIWAAGLILQAMTVLLTGFSAFYIWRQLKILALTGQAQVSENLASQSIDILRHLAGTPHLYEYFYDNRPLRDGESDLSNLLCSAEIVANFLEHIFLQRESLPLTSREAWMKYVLDHYESSLVVRDFIASHQHWYAKVFLNYVAGSTHKPLAARRER